MAEAPLHVLWVTPRYPVGVADGACHATRQLVAGLTRQGAEVEMISVVQKYDPSLEVQTRDELGVRLCTSVIRRRSLWSRLPSWKTPFTFRAFSTKAVRRQLCEALGWLLNVPMDKERSVVVFDGLHPLAAFSHTDLERWVTECRGVIYRAHNVETTLWSQCAQRARTPWFRWFFEHQARLVGRIERRIVSSVTAVAPVSPEDAQVFKRWGVTGSLWTTPIGIAFPSEQAVASVPAAQRLEVLFVGRLDWLPNRDGLQWLLERVWPRVIAKRPACRLRIAGLGNGGYLERYRHLPGIQLLGAVPEVKPLYESSHIAVAPLFQGSGTRVKIIESSRYARPVLTTALGAEGTGLVPGSSYFQAETQEEWTAHLVGVDAATCGTMGLSAFRQMRERFEESLVAQTFHDHLKSLRVKSA